uniref:Uncharacterized protein n=1 Tax=Strigamia maritima TaxID=126957 RepID=T1IZ45_STRMM
KQLYEKHLKFGVKDLFRLHNCCPKHFIIHTAFIFDSAFIRFQATEHSRSHSQLTNLWRKRTRVTLRIRLNRSWTLATRVRIMNGDKLHYHISNFHHTMAVFAFIILVATFHVATAQPLFDEENGHVDRVLSHVKRAPMPFFFPNPRTKKSQTQTTPRHHHHHRHPPPPPEHQWHG